MNSLDTVIPLSVFLTIGMVVLKASIRDLPEAERRWMMRLLIVAFSARLLAATTFVLFPQLRFFHEDADGYELAGLQLSTYWRGEGPPYPVGGANYGYYYLSGILYFLFGRFQAVPSYFNAILGSLLAVLIYKLTTRMFHTLVARRAALLVALMPSMILWSSIALKDVVSTFTIVVALFSCVVMKDRVTAASVFGVILPLAAVQTVRFYVSYFVAFAVVVSLLLERGKRMVMGVYKQIFIVFAIIALFALLGLTGGAESNIDYFNLEYASQYRQGMAVSARSGFGVGVDVSTPALAIAYLPMGVAHLLLAPFPWQMTGLRPLMAAPETILWWCLFPATIRGIVFSVRRRFAQTSPLLIFTTTLTLTYSLVQGNVGAAFRQRAQILVFLFIFCAVGMYQKRCRKAGIDVRNLLSVDAPPDVVRQAAE